MSPKDLNQRHRTTSIAIIIGALLNILLASVKCLAGWLGHSTALLADGIHSFSDLFADLVVFIASKFGSAEADCEHPYGHQRIETAGTIIVALFLSAAGISIIIAGTTHIAHPHKFTQIQPYVLWVALLTIAINEIIYHITRFMAEKIDSELLRAHAWHRRSDAAAALVVLVGIIGAMFGFSYLDGIAAIIIGVFILKMAVQMGRKSLDELIDRGLSQQKLDQIVSVIKQEPGVAALHQLRTRFMGGKIFADVHIIVHPKISVSEGHYIGDNVRASLQKHFSKIDDILVHVDSENDELYHLQEKHPTRSEIIACLKNTPLPASAQMHLKAIHYFKNQCTLELAFPLSCLSAYSKEMLQEAYLQHVVPLLPQVTLEFYFY